MHKGTKGITHDALDLLNALYIIGHMDRGTSACFEQISARLTLLSKHGTQGVPN